MGLDHADVTANRHDDTTAVADAGRHRVQPELGRRNSPPEHRPLPGNNAHSVSDSALTGCGNRETAPTGVSGGLLARGGSAGADSGGDAAVGMAS